MTGEAQPSRPGDNPTSHPDARPAGDARFTRLAYLVLAYTLFVIVFGAWVRVTGSGAGCGQHWPTCHGEVVHRPQTIETLIELTHRVTSGLSLLFAGGLAVLAFRRFRAPHLARTGTVLAVVFLIVEALLGAGLVKFGLVADDDSIARAIGMAIHLTNTSILMGALAMAAWAGAGVARVRWRGGRSGWLLIAGLVGVLVVSMSGAVTALGDTLFPVAADGTVVEQLARDQSVTAHFLQRMRVLHPILAVGVGLYVLWLAIGRPRLGSLVAGLVCAQLCAGVANVMLSAPGWMQLLHLALATALWTALVVLVLDAQRQQPVPDQRQT